MSGRDRPPEEYVEEGTRRTLWNCLQLTAGMAQAGTLNAWKVRDLVFRVRVEIQRVLAENKALREENAALRAQARRDIVPPSAIPARDFIEIDVVETRAITDRS